MFLQTGSWELWRYLTFTHWAPFPHCMHHWLACCCGAKQSKAAWPAPLLSALVSGNNVWKITTKYIEVKYLLFSELSLTAQFKSKENSLENSIHFSRPTEHLQKFSLSLYNCRLPKLKLKNVPFLGTSGGVNLRAEFEWKCPFTFFYSMQASRDVLKLGYPEFLRFFLNNRTNATSNMILHLPR